MLGVDVFDTTFFNSFCYWVLGFTGLMLAILFFFNAPYGRQNLQDTHPLWGPNIPLKLSWFILEAPVFFSFAFFFWQGNNALLPVPLILFLLFELHYFHRTFIYPLSLKPKPGSGFRLGVLAFGIPLNAANGYINGYYISQYAIHLNTLTWLLDPRFIIGCSLFFFGFWLTKNSDKLLANLRKPGETGYKIPYGGAFKWVSSPNYLGEIIQWAGFAIAAWSFPGFIFFCLTVANLLPRALSNQKWYHEKFSRYPKKRKALIPFVI